MGRIVGLNGKPLEEPKTREWGLCRDLFAQSVIDTYKSELLLKTMLVRGALIKTLPWRERMGHKNGPVTPKDAEPSAPKGGPGETV